MKFYHIKDDFIAYLQKFDTKVAENKNQTRPYVGVVLEINSVKYYAPFSSPKPKHKKMKNGKDFRKINNGLYGAINFNNMIPVPDSEIIKYDLNDEGDLKYKLIVFNDLYFVRQNSEKIERTAKNLYEAKKNQQNEPEGKKPLLAITLDFANLEKLCDAYKKK